MTRTRSGGVQRSPRLADMAAAVARVPAQKAAMNTALLALEARAEQWTREHPSAVEELNRIAREREARAAMIEMHAAFAERLHGFIRLSRQHRAAPSSADAAADALAGRARGTFRR
jgi:hypothetical protein